MKYVFIFPQSVSSITLKTTFYSTKTHQFPHIPASHLNKLPRFNHIPSSLPFLTTSTIHSYHLHPSFSTTLFQARYASYSYHPMTHLIPYLFLALSRIMPPNNKSHQKKQHQRKLPPFPRNQLLHPRNQPLRDQPSDESPRKPKEMIPLQTMMLTKMLVTWRKTITS